jgi:hypothetical protein
MRINRVTICGVSRPVQMNMAALMYMAKKTGKTMLELFDSDRFDEHEVFIAMYAAILHGADAAGEKCDLKYSEFVTQITLEEEDEKALEELGDYIKEDLKEVVAVLVAKEKKKALKRGAPVEEKGSPA